MLWDLAVCFGFNFCSVKPEKYVDSVLGVRVGSGSGSGLGSGSAKFKDQPSANQKEIKNYQAQSLPCIIALL